MPKKIRVKICGLCRLSDVKHAVTAGVRYLGLNFFPPSSRHVTAAEALKLVIDLPEKVVTVGLFVDASNDMLHDVIRTVPLNMLQLHGAESPDRVIEVKERFGLPVIKAIGISNERDLEILDHFLPVADQILVDAKPSSESNLPGGNGLPFDWNLIAGRKWSIPWMLAGGLTPSNLVNAITVTGACQVDLSSGVESAPGVKDHDLIDAFMQAVKSVAFD
ncbi:MAG: phosphoribosylanthranilate isomerase [Aestuariivita sp.]|nr:phosphoribosylanthranilate isomerase [Aestuariivita sp.]